MKCKYCRNINHKIDECPEILCKNCNKKGHPHWNCKEKKNVEKIKSLKPQFKLVEEFNKFKNDKWGDLLL